MSSLTLTLTLTLILTLTLTLIGGVRTLVVTGHSLGGALATLAALDFHLLYGSQRPNPNPNPNPNPLRLPKGAAGHLWPASSREPQLRGLVPERGGGEQREVDDRVRVRVWVRERSGERSTVTVTLTAISNARLISGIRLVCERDVIPTTPKRQFTSRDLGCFKETYKHTGFEVVIMKNGGIVMMPDYFEKSFVLGTSFICNQYSINDHAMAAYEETILKIIRLNTLDGCAEVELYDQILPEQEEGGGGTEASILEEGPLERPSSSELSPSEQRTLPRSSSLQEMLNLRSQSNRRSSLRQVRTMQGLEDDLEDFAHLNRS